MAEDTVEFKLSEATPQKLTSWKKEPSILELKRDLESAKPAHDAQISRIERWNDLMAVRGAYKPKKIAGRSSVQPKLVRRQAEWRYSALSEPFLGSSKLYKVSPTTFEDEAAAKQNELVLNWQFRTKMNRVKFIDDFVRATVDEGTSIIRVGWKRHTITAKEEVPVYEHYQITTQEQMQLFQQALEAHNQDVRTFRESAPPELVEAISYFIESQQPTYVVQNGTQTVDVEKVVENRPTVEVLNPKNVTIDPSCNGDLDKALFIEVSFESNQAELKKEGKRYKNLDKVNWEGNAPLMEPNHETKTPLEYNFNDKMRKKVVVHEYWGFYDIHGNGNLVPIVAAWIGDVIIRMEENPFPDEKLPFVVVPYLPVKRDLMGEPDAELLEDNQAIQGALTRGMIDLLGRSANGQQGWAKGALDPLNKRRFEQGENYEFNPNMPPQTNYLEHKYPEIPRSALEMLNLQNQDAESLTGVKSFSGGVSGEAYGDVAAGIRGALDAASKREMAILRRLAKGMTEIGNKIIAMNAVFLTEEETVRVTNEEFVKVKREDLKGNFDLETDISTVEVDNAKAQDMAFMLQTVGPNMPDLAQMIMAEIAELKRMPALAHKIKNFKPQPDPMMEQMKQAELQKAMMEIEVLKSEVALNQAKAKQAASLADKADLDFVEQETGTAHARDMEKQKAQSQGNQALAVTKALVTPKKKEENKPDVNAAIGWNAISDGLSDVTRSNGTRPAGGFPLGQL
jgi:hypothetical protein